MLATTQKDNDQTSENKILFGDFLLLLVADDETSAVAVQIFYAIISGTPILLCVCVYECINGVVVCQICLSFIICIAVTYIWRVNEVDIYYIYIYITCLKYNIM